jgi:hypothetical protein
MKKLLVLLSVSLIMFACNKENAVTPERKSINIDVYGCAAFTPEAVNFSITYEVDGISKTDVVLYDLPVITIDDVMNIPVIYHKVLRVYENQIVKVSVIQNNLMNSSISLRAYSDDLPNNKSVIHLTDDMQFNVRLIENAYMPIEIYKL